MKTPQFHILIIVLTLSIALVLQWSFEPNSLQFAQQDSLSVIQPTHKPRILLFATIGFLSALALYLVVLKRKNKKQR